MSMIGLRVAISNFRSVEGCQAHPAVDSIYGRIELESADLFMVRQDLGEPVMIVFDSWKDKISFSKAYTMPFSHSKSTINGS